MDPPAIRHETLSGAALGHDALAALFARAYSDYIVPLHVDAAALRFMASAFDIDLAASCVVHVAEQPVAFALLAHRGSEGWIGGMGVVPEFRRHGFGRIAMLAVIARARALGLREVWLEVLEQNAAAIPLYEALGFQRVRELEVWSFPQPPRAGAGFAAVSAPLDEARAFLRGARRGREPWQRAHGTVERLARMVPAPEATLLRAGDRIVGAAIHRMGPGRVSVLQLTLSDGCEPAALPELLGSLAREDAPQGLRWLNLPAEDPAAAWVRASGAAREAGQIEMRLALD